VWVPIEKTVAAGELKVGYNLLPRPSLGSLLIRVRAAVNAYPAHGGDSDGQRSHRFGLCHWRGSVVPAVLQRIRSWSFAASAWDMVVVCANFSKSAPGARFQLEAENTDGSTGGSATSRSRKQTTAHREPILALFGCASESGWR
jgi:hypothetical protein